MVAISILFILIEALFFVETAKQKIPPNIVFILADDLGWNDVSYHGSPQIPTPNIDALAASGIILKNYYAQCLCTPSRAALLTGKYPIRSGLQHFVVTAGEPSGLPLNITILPQHLKKLGYATHIVGKWHLGYKTKEYTPIYRGFDTFFGFFNGFVDYYDYTHTGTSKLPFPPVYYGIDLQDGITPIKNFRGRYFTDVLTEKAESIILNHDSSKPLFLYVSHLAVHTGASFMPEQAPPDLAAQFGYIHNLKRRYHAATVSSLDNSVGRVFQALHKTGLLQNSIIVFASDNGGDLTRGSSSNYPLRGQKFNLFEGGIHVPALIWSPLFKLKTSKVSDYLMHITDWLPTLYTAAGGNVNDLGDIDGYNMWEALQNLPYSPRKNLLHNVDPIFGMSALRVGDLKLINGTSPQKLIYWYGNNSSETTHSPTSMDEWVFKNGSLVREILEQTGMWIEKKPDEWRKKPQINCKQPAPSGNGGCDPTVKPCLFNITNDPCEYQNLADTYPELVDSMMKVINDYKAIAARPQSTSSDPHADPRCHGFTYVPWMDKEHSSSCTAVPYEGTSILHS